MKNILKLLSLTGLLMCSFASLSARAEVESQPYCELDRGLTGAYVVLNDGGTGQMYGKHFRGWTDEECDLAQLDAEKLQADGKCKDIIDNCRSDKHLSNPPAVGEDSSQN
jgi:hypothetical protein